MEKELRSLKGRGHFPIPTITPHGTRIENPLQVRKTLESVDEELVQILTTVRESERMKKNMRRKKRKLESENNKQKQQDHHKAQSTISSA